MNAIGWPINTGWRVRPHGHTILPGQSAVVMVGFMAVSEVVRMPNIPPGRPTTDKEISK